MCPNQTTGFIPYLLTNFELPNQLTSSRAWQYSSDWPIWKVQTGDPSLVAHVVALYITIHSQAQAVQATSAAKTYFPEVCHDGIDYIDGAFACNNPSELTILLCHVCPYFAPPANLQPDPGKPHLSRRPNNT